MSTFDEPTGEARKSSESASNPPLDLLPLAAMEEIAEVLAFDANKYGAYNWARGARWGRYFAALLRHTWAWWRGEDRDPETGKSHLAHAGACLLFLMEYQRNGWGTDDRFRGADDQQFRKDDGIAPAKPQPHGGRLVFSSEPPPSYMDTWRRAHNEVRELNASTVKLARRIEAYSQRLNAEQGRPWWRFWL
jgi:hypothetical protein